MVTYGTLTELDHDLDLEDREGVKICHGDLYVFPEFEKLGILTLARVSWDTVFTHGGTLYISPGQG